ncbi:MAG: hypothetical protein HeimC2_15390 [Candidatus Heimdallarchaeota archaeon LC_2]|nr:MAG: hypothetical protein HeimC2_15390 [Candidatus Heimdallarchaeota archaeon LC_2]
MRIHAVYVIVDDGRCAYFKAFSEIAPSSHLVSAMLTAMQVFVKEVVGSNFSEITAGPFSFISEQAGPFSIVVVGTKSQEASEKSKYLVLRFIRKYKTMIENWKGELIDFVDFDEDVNEVFGMTEGLRVDPKIPLDAIALLQIKESLQPIARRILARYEISIEDMAKDLDLTFIVTANLLNELFELGYIGRFRRDDKTFYFIK